MSKIVIPKHSADIDEMNAVLKIHYEAGDWVKGSDFMRQLMAIIGASSKCERPCNLAVTRPPMRG